MEPEVIFLVDELTDGKYLGYTNSMFKIRHNLNRMPKGYAEEFFNDLSKSDTGVTVFAGVGRYVCMIAMAKDGLTCAMTFFDTRQDELLAEKITGQFKSDTLKKGFMDQHHLLQEHYNRDYFQVQLSTETFPLN